MNLPKSPSTQVSACPGNSWQVPENFESERTGWVARNPGLLQSPEDSGGPAGIPGVPFLGTQNLDKGFLGPQGSKEPKPKASWQVPGNLEFGGTARLPGTQNFPQTQKIQVHSYQVPGIQNSKKSVLGA